MSHGDHVWMVNFNDSVMTAREFMFPAGSKIWTANRIDRCWRFFMLVIWDDGYRFLTLKKSLTQGFCYQDLETVTIETDQYYCSPLVAISLWAITLSHNFWAISQDKLPWYLGVYQNISDRKERRIVINWKSDVIVRPSSAEGTGQKGFFKYSKVS